MLIFISTFAVIGAFVAGLWVGNALGEHYHSKKECRDCRRRMVVYGFHSDGMEYKAEPRRGII